MQESKFNVVDIVLELMDEGKSLDEIIAITNLDKHYLKSLLSKIKSSIVSELDDQRFPYIKTINETLKKKTNKRLMRNYSEDKKKIVLYLLSKNRTFKDLTIIMNLTPCKCLSLLKSIYYDIYMYDIEEEKQYIPLIKKCLSQATTHMKPKDSSQEKSIIINPLDEFAVFTNHRDEIFISNTKIQQVYELESEHPRFIVISDTHFGSIFESIEYLEMVYEYAIKHGIKYIFHCGDLIEGEEYYDSGRSKWEYRNIYLQIEHILNDYCYDESIKNIILLGNHDVKSLKVRGIDLNDVLRERSDFISLGYRNGYIKVKDDYIALKHDIKRMLNPNYSLATSLSFSGHTHQYRCKFDDKSVRFIVPTLSNMRSEKEVVNIGFLVGELDLSNKIDRIKIDYIDLTNESRVYTFERKKHI